MAPEYIGPGFTSGTTDSAWDRPPNKEDRSLVSKQKRIEMFLWASRLDPDRDVGYRGCLDTAHEC